MSDCSTEAFKAKEPHARMTKTKSQLRAEAVERLRKLNCMDVDCYQLLEAAVDDAGEKVGYRVEISKLIDLLTPDAHEARGSYEERLHDVPVSECPYCGCKRVVIHDFNDIYEEPHSYRVEHVDEKEAFEAGCFETYYAFDSAEKAVEHANMHTLSIDDGTPSNTDVTCPDADRTASIEQGGGVAKLDAQARAEIEDMKRSRAVSGDAGQDADVDSTENAKAAQDSREKLEEDVRQILHSAYMLAWMHGNKNRRGSSFEKLHVEFYNLLDRQAAITERECADRYVNTWTEGSVAWILRQYEDEKLMRDVDCEAKIALETEELQDRIDELEAALKGERNNFYQAMESRKHWQREYENLKVASETYRDGMHAKARRVGEVKAERDMYRDKLGRAIDAAHEIARMMEVE